jgi:hypothetical protein
MSTADHPHTSTSPTPLTIERLTTPNLPDGRLAPPTHCGGWHLVSSANGLTVWRRILLTDSFDSWRQS